MYTLYRNQTNQTQMSFPRESILQLPASLAQGVNSIQQRVLPTTGSGSYVASSTSFGTPIKFTIDSQPQTMMDPQTLCLSGRVVFSNLGTVETNKHVLLGSILSAFSSIKVRSNSLQIEEIVNPGPLFSRLWDLVLDRSAKLALSSLLLFDVVNPGCQGIVVNSNNSTTTGGDSHNGLPSATTFSFCIPIPGLISSLTTYFPLYASNLEYEFTLDNPSNYCTQILTAAASVPTLTFSSMELVFQSLRFEGESFARIMEATPTQDGMLCLKSSTWQYNSAQVAASTSAGRLDLLYPLSARSIKKIVMWGSAANSPGKLFDGHSLNLTGIQLVSGSHVIPQQPVSMDSPAFIMMENQRAMSALFSSSHCGNIHPRAFAKSATAHTALWTAYETDAAYLGAAIESATGLTSLPLLDLSLVQNKFVYIMDLETIGGNRDGLFHGFTTRGNGSSVLRMTIGTQLNAQAHVWNMWSEIDTKILISPDLFQTVVDN
ncbi:hypothetical protein EON65_14775 [archaeon]|nr:MAG: hypothetical protein EON65_14775 [archaeon]